MKVPENQPAEMILTTSGVKNFVVRHALGSDRQISSMLHGFLNLAGKECNAGAILMDFDHANLILSQKAFEMLGFKSGTSYKLKDVEEVLSGTNSDAVSKLFLNAFEQPHPINQEFHCEINSENKTLKLILEKADNGKQIVGLLQEMRTANKGALKMHNSTDLFEVSGIGLAVLNLKGEIFQANPSYCKLLGYDENEIVGKSFVAFTHPDDLESSNTCLQNLASGKIKTAELEKRYIHKNGDYVEVQILANVLFDKKGKTDRIVSQIQDITKKKRKEQAMIMESEKQLNTIKKLQLKNTQLEDFGHIVSHNLRTPAGNIKMLLDLMLVSKTEEEQKQWVDALVDSSNNLIDTLDDLLELIRYTNEGNLKFEKLSIEETLRDILTEMSEHIKEVNPEIIVNFEKLPSISYPKIYLHSILSNLITNAIKYRDEDRPLKITLSSGINEDGLEYLNVADNGIGIDLKRFGNQLFQLNRTFTKRKDSTGFGLFMVKRQLEVLGGCISCKSEPDKGAEFTVILKSK